MVLVCDATFKKSLLARLSVTGLLPLSGGENCTLSSHSVLLFDLWNEWICPAACLTTMSCLTTGFKSSRSTQPLTRTSMGLLNHWPELQWVYSTIDQNLNGNHWLGSLWVYTTTGQNLCGSIQPLTRTFETVCWNRSLLFPNSLRINFYRLLTDTIRLGWGRKKKTKQSRSKSGDRKQNSPHTERHNFNSMDNSEQCQVDFQKGRIQCFHHTCEEQTHGLDKEQLWKRVLVWS